MIILLTLAVAILAAAVIYGDLRMSASLDRLTASVSTLTTNVAAVVAEVNSLKAGTDDAALAALADQVDAANTALQNVVPPPA